MPKDLHTGRYRIEPGHEARLSDFDPNDTSGFEGKDEEELRESKKLNDKLRQLQELLDAEHEQKVLVILQAMDTGGKDGVINRVFQGVNPQGVRVAHFKEPTPEELDHGFLWREHRQVPGKGNLRFSTGAITRAFSSREFTRSFPRKCGVIDTGRSTISSGYSPKRTR